MQPDDTTKTIKTAQSWISQDKYDDIPAAIIEGQRWLDALLTAKDSDPKAIGPVLGALNGRLGRMKAMNPVAWFELSDGKIAVGHRPSKKKLDELKLQGVSHVLTLLTGGEGALAVKKSVKAAGLDWIWFAMEGGDPLGPERDSEAESLFKTLEGLLKNQSQIYIHCSAGIHRTGMIANALLRYLALNQDAANEALLALRQETSEGVGDHRLAWGKRFERLKAD